MIYISTKELIFRLIKLQLLWYLINFITIFLQHQIPLLNIEYIFEIYLLTFLIVGRSFFISVLLYLSTMVYQLNFKILGLSKDNLYHNLKLGFKTSNLLLPGLIIINLVSNYQDLDPLFQIRSLNDLSKSLIYFLIIFICYLIPAFSKELFFRGFITYQFRQFYNPKRAFLFSICYYVISHFDLRLYIILINLLVALITTYLYYKSDSLLPGTIFQAFYKAAVTVYLIAPGKIL